MTSEPTLDRGEHRQFHPQLNEGGALPPPRIPMPAAHASRPIGTPAGAGADMEELLPGTPAHGKGEAMPRSELPDRLPEDVNDSNDGEMRMPSNSK